MSDSAASLLSSPGVFLARLSSWLQAKSSDHVSFAFWRSYKASKNSSSTAILTCLPKRLIFCRHWGGRTAADWDSSRHRERCPQGAKLKPVHPRSSEFTSPHGRLILSHQCAGLKEASAQLLWACGVLCIPRAESSRAADLCYDALISSATFGKSRASLDGKTKRESVGFCSLPFPNPPSKPGCLRF